MSNSIRPANAVTYPADRVAASEPSQLQGVEGAGFAQAGRAEKGMPALLIFSDADSIVKMGWLQRMEQLFPEHRSIVLHGSHHFPQEYDPASVVTAIRSWLDEQIAM